MFQSKKLEKDKVKAFNTIFCSLNSQESRRNQENVIKINGVKLFGVNSFFIEVIKINFLFLYLIVF